MRFRLSFGGRIEDWVHVGDCDSVDSFKVIDENPQSTDIKNPDPVESNRVRPVW